MSKPQTRWCFVPGCKNTSISASKKLFISVPQNHSRKMKWFRAARRDVPKSKSTIFCCEDHFNVNVVYLRIRWKFFFKSGVIPHIFNCQLDRKRAASASERYLSLKIRKRRIMKEVLINENVKNVGVQVKPLYRSKYVSCNIQAKVCNTASSPGKFFVMKKLLLRS
ncbi:hypothetical protein RN001_001055 [Aquatica leii]|uniref:THAP-type domain-containing protein n=1 Tax=Aquatica leii TaxID=1421715 RepID=A0AAN7PFN9_9COLE|nr:hypothetical protein RN001_001055 [Aquatica leii]